MATVKFSALITGIRGLLGGTIFSNAIGGPTIRTAGRTRTSKPYLRTRRNAQLGSWSRWWLYHLTDLQRTDWINEAADTDFVNSLGVTYNPTGQGLYIRSQTLLELTGQANVTAAPDPAIAAISAATVIFHPPNGLILDTLTPWDDAAEPALLILASPPKNLSIYEYHKGYSLLTVLDDPIIDPPYPIFLETSEVVLDRRYFFTFRNVEPDGAVSLKFFADVSTDTPDPDILWYTLNDDADSDTILDYLEGYNGQLLTDGVDWTSLISVDGCRGTALEFDATNNEYVRSPSRTWTTGDFSISFWFYLDNMPAVWSTIAEAYQGAGDGWMIQVGTATDQIRLRWIDAPVVTDVVFADPGEITEDTWHKCTFVREDTDVFCYLDGVKTGEDLGADFPTGYPKRFQLGAMPGHPIANVAICDFRVYNRALTLAEIQVI